jgi:hypothetical protein
LSESHLWFRRFVQVSEKIYWTLPITSIWNTLFSRVESCDDKWQLFRQENCWGTQVLKGCPHGLNLHKKWGREGPAQRKQIYKKKKTKSDKTHKDLPRSIRNMGRVVRNSLLFFLMLSELLASGSVKRNCEQEVQSLAGLSSTFSLFF